MELIGGIVRRLFSSTEDRLITSTDGTVIYSDTALITGTATLLHHIRSGQYLQNNIDYST